MKDRTTKSGKRNCGSAAITAPPHAHVHARNGRDNHAQRLLAVGAVGLRVGVDRDRQLVFAVLDLPSEDLHLMGNVQLKIQLTPSEARELAQTLVHEAYAVRCLPQRPHAQAGHRHGMFGNKN